MKNTDNSCFSCGRQNCIYVGKTEKKIKRVMGILYVKTCVCDSFVRNLKENENVGK